MVNIEQVSSEIVKRLEPLSPDKVILFGSYAYGTPTKYSDIDLFLIKDDLTNDNSKEYTLKARKQLRDIILNYDTNGIDIISASTDYLNTREDYFYKIDILQNGKVIYERNIS